MSILDAPFAGLPIILQAAPDAERVASALESIDLGKIFAAMVILAVCFGLNKLIDMGVNRLSSQLRTRRLTLGHMASFVKLAVFVVGAYLVASTLLENQRGAAVGVLGSVALAVGFALKDTVSSVVAGVLILFDQPFQVGDRVRFGEVYGDVQHIGLRTVRVLTLEGRMVSIPNNKFLTDEVASMNRGELPMMVEAEFYIAVSSDADLAHDLVYRACVTSRYIDLDQKVSMRMREGEFGAAFATVVKCKAWIIDSRFEELYLSDVTCRVKHAFNKHRIQSPYARLVEVPGREEHDR
ncbi:MAG: mechanosensitive ion channel family protein, partial [Persicimonas sp.]